MAERELGYEVCGFHECIKFDVDESGEGVNGGKDGVHGIMDGIVECCFAVLAGKEEVTV